MICVLSAMNKPKYQIGDRLGNTNLYVRGVMTNSKGENRYYLQIGDTDNTLVINESDYDEPEEIKYPPDEYRVWSSDRNFSN